MKTSIKIARLQKKMEIIQEELDMLVLGTEEEKAEFYQKGDNIAEFVGHKVKRGAVL